MGILDKFFKKKDTEEPRQVYKPDWDFYFSNVDDKFSSIAVDLGLRKIAPIEDQPNLVWVTINMNNPRPDGLSSNEESEILGDIEDAIVVGLHQITLEIYTSFLVSPLYTIRPFLK